MQQQFLEKIEQALEKAVPLSQACWGREALPACLAQAMRYSLLAGGKRLRPLMLLHAYDLLADDVEVALPFACALEMIHTYSLIHDDLPCMDNDDLRRGQPTSHKKFGENVAVLAGDALLNGAFELMAGSKHVRALPALSVIAKSAGGQGMIAGQMADIAMEHQTPSAEMVTYIQQRKTGALFEAAVLSGLILAGADEEQLAAGRAYAGAFGLAFQISDDVLDVVGQQSVVGKTLGKDEVQGKMTWPAVFGLENSIEEVKKQVRLACDALQIFPRNRAPLVQLAESLVHRIK